MVAVNASSGRVYVSDGGHNQVEVFARTFAPTLGRELVSEVGTSEAKLGALINAGGEDTHYYFEYGTTSAYGHATPFPIGDAGTGLTPTTVWASASGLQPGTTYHYRVIATSALGTVTGPDQTFETETAAQGSCPNEQLRLGFSAGLPDCRAYEQVTVPNDASAEPDPFYTASRTNWVALNHASREGDRLSYFSIDVLPGSQTGIGFYLATRGTNGWSSENVAAPTDYYGFGCDVIGLTGGPSMGDYSADMSSLILSEGGNEVRGENTNTGECDGLDPELVSGEPPGVQNLFVRDNQNGTYQLVDVVPPGITPANASLHATSEDDSHVVFSERARLTPEAPGGVEDLYEWDEGVVRLVTVLPNGTPAVGSLATSSVSDRSVSADGSRVFFTAGGNLYVRENAEQSSSEECARPASACTVQIDASQMGGNGGGGRFDAASADGSRVLFTDENKLTFGSSAAPNEPDLYEYDASTGQLTDLSAVSSGHANVKGVIGISEDASYVYFAAAGVLAANENSHGEKAKEGQANLYLRHEGSTTFIAGVNLEFEACLWSEPCARVSSDGAYFAFTSQKGLTGYDNTDLNTGLTDPEIFLYSAASGQLDCTSCDPTGESPTAVRTEGGTPLGAQIESRGSGVPHYLSNSGRVFFETAEPLVPRDTNGQVDVYEFEPDGVGSCGEAGGCIALISTGTAAAQTMLIDASADGSDVFLRELQRLTPQDTQESEAISIVDARVDGGFSALSASPPCSTADSCRAAPSPQPAIYGEPSSATFAGAGNVAPPMPSPPTGKSKPKSKNLTCRKGLVKKNGKCIKRKKEPRRSAHVHKAGR